MLLFGLLVATSFSLHLLIKTRGHLPVSVIGFVYKAALVTWLRSTRRMMFDAAVLLFLVVYLYSGGTLS